MHLVSIKLDNVLGPLLELMSCFGEVIGQLVASLRPTDSLSDISTARQGYRIELTPTIRDTRVIYASRRKIRCDRVAIEGCGVPNGS